MYLRQTSNQVGTGKISYTSRKVQTSYRADKESPHMNMQRRMQSSICIRSSKIHSLIPEPNRTRSAVLRACPLN